MLAELLHRYGQPHRRYHTESHILFCIEKLESVPLEMIADRIAVGFAVFFHDIVYEVRSPLHHENEIRSAAFAESALEEGGAAEDLTGRVVALILATKHKKLQPADDCGYVADIDLAILGESWVTFQRYSLAIREEYANIPDDKFRPARIAFMRTLLAREHLYATKIFRDQYETKARANIVRHIEQLEREAILGPNR
jgi:predicted metal-dependent HD superfamily phosphohydrolase